MGTATANQGIASLSPMQANIPTEMFSNLQNQLRGLSAPQQNSPFSNLQNFAANQNQGQQPQGMGQGGFGQPYGNFRGPQGWTGQSPYGFSQRSATAQGGIGNFPGAGLPPPPQPFGPANNAFPSPQQTPRYQGMKFGGIR